MHPATTHCLRAPALLPARSFRALSRLLAPTAFLLALVPALYAQDTTWTPLFNGRDLSGWAHVGKGRFVVENGLLKTEGGMGLLWYTERAFEDVVLRVVYRHPDGANSGVFIRIPEKPDDPLMPVRRGYEVQIDDTRDDYHVTGVLYSFTKALARPAQPDVWNTMEITLKGNRTIVTVNGKQVTDHTEGEPLRGRRWWEFWMWWKPKEGARPERGYIGLQNHSSKDTVYFREISVRPVAG